MSHSLLIVDDEEDLREDLAELLSDLGFDCRTADCGEAALEEIRADEPDLVLCDLSMPGMDGVELVERVVEDNPTVAILMMTAYGSLDTALAAFRNGAVDYLLKPLQQEELLAKIGRALNHRKTNRELRFLRRAVSQAEESTRLVGSSPEMRSVRDLIRRVAAVESPVLITGETGTGKEVVARSIHEAGHADTAPFVAVNCAALPRDLVESELFGYRKGAFSGATSDKPGLLEVARGGTLFLDEIGDLPLDLQPKLLRVLESGELLPIGGTRPIPTRFRLLAATHRDLSELMESGKFRQDLYYRLAVVEIELPPLRAHLSDVPELVDHLMVGIRARLKRQIDVDDSALRRLSEASWPGNVRELENALERAVLLADSGPLTSVDFLNLGEAERGTAQNLELKSRVREFELGHIRRVLATTGGNREEAARALGINPSTLYRRLQNAEGED
ncbi:MAG: sigma-54-dependent Fis family transcriptional regulator [Acidobacteria bacterium]|nr:MAG: sigma-54-dependent Fis family transcriptional regulator [Acidobacteriota bacterium]REK04452.1 MAG: sigma-54-dependent Fis family transcriptional regulator [Acidobacteriota bacterium]